MREVLLSSANEASDIVIGLQRNQMDVEARSAWQANRYRPIGSVRNDRIRAE